MNRPDPDNQKTETQGTNEESLFVFLLDTLQSNIVFFLKDGTVLRTNHTARKTLCLTGKSEEVKLSDLLSVESRNKDVLFELLSGLNESQTKHVSLPTDCLIHVKNSDTVFFASGSISRRNDNFLLSFRNVVDERTQDYMLDMTLSSSKIFPWFYDFKRQTMIINRRYFDYTGIPSADCTMTPEEYADRINPEERDSVIHALTLQMNGEHYPYPVQFRLRRGDGTYEWFEGQSTYLGKVKGMPYRIVGICMSVQAHKDIEAALITAKNKAEESVRLKNAFLANMSHEIRTPLNAIVGFSHLLTNGDVDSEGEEAQEYASLINKNCDHLLTLVSDILDLSRVETGAMEYKVEECSLNVMLSELYDKYQSRVPEAVEFNLLLTYSEVKIVTDPLRLRQVMEHLITNALKFTAKGRIDLGCVLSEDGGSVRLFVSDTGCGIPAEQTDRIFERFYKVDSFVQGAGLGLSICKIITDQLGGKISVSSLFGKGSRFTVKLPRNF